MLQRAPLCEALHRYRDLGWKRPFGEELPEVMRPRLVVEQDRKPVVTDCHQFTERAFSRKVLLCLQIFLSNVARGLDVGAL